MLPSFLSMETITRGLYLQQLSQQITATNLANNYLDSNGYLINSLEQINTTTGAPYLFSQLGGNLSVGSGPLVQSITRLRDSFLDSQIQRQSSIVGKDEILSNVLGEVNTILNGSAGTVDQSITDLANAFAALAPNPLSIGLRSTVVNDGVAFANISNNQFLQLENLQNNLSGQVTQTVTNINSILQQLNTLNKQLLATSAGVNVNSLLDARDYALDRLSRLINIQTSFGTAGTVSVFLAGSSLSLVDSAGAAILQSNVLNPHNPNLSDITIQSSEGTVTLKDASRWITGGNLGGELYARDVVLQNYKVQLDAVVTSVMTNTNNYIHAGYASDGVTTGINFFSGTSARDIGVNAVLVTDPTRASLAVSSRYGVTTNGQIAQFLGNLRTLLANNDMESSQNINVNAPPNSFIDPTQAMTSLVNTPLNVNGSNSTNFATVPAGGVQTFTLNNTTVSYNESTDSIYSILDKINAADPNVQAVFDYTNQKIMILSNNPILLTNDTGNFKVVGALNNILISTFRMNNEFAGRDPLIVPGPGNTIVNPYLAMFSTQQEPLPSGRGPNAQAFLVTPGTNGTFVVNGVTFNWSNQPPPNSPVAQTLVNILNQINITMTVVGNRVAAQFSGAIVGSTEKVKLLSPDVPITIVDTLGNFTVFTGLNGNTPIGNLSTGILTQVSNDVSNQNLVQNQDQALLTQLNNSQANIAAVSTTAGQPGVPIAVIEQQAMQSLIAYNASLQVLQIQNQMFSDLITAISGGATSTSSGTIALQGR